jgi:hypothetical protein
MIENKSINNQNYFLGQYMTPVDLANKLLSDLEISENNIYIEPSFGTGNFIRALLNNGVNTNQIIGCELDSNLFKIASEYNFEKYLMNFYDWKFTTRKKIIFVGNPPFRTPAYSLRSHPHFVKNLCKKYNIKGIREESVFFLLRCLEIIEENDNGGEIRFIMPETLFTNNSKFFVRFQNLIHEKFDIEYVKEIPNGVFESASLKMVFIVLKYVKKQKSTKINNREDYWNYNQIFKRTYLGSVPCESIFLSCRNENKEDFKNRMIRLYSSDLKDLDSNLRFQGLAHLKVLNSENEELKLKKLEVIWNYLEEIKEKLSDSFSSELENLDNYKQINHRHEIRYYFRNPILKKMSFVYEINPNPTKSFYFTGNPSKSSTDYFGYCDYDITRNSSPGACRTIPINNVESNLTDEFKKWWKENNLGDYEKVFDLFITTSKSMWYKNMKKNYNRFYFGIPKKIEFLSNL